MTALGFVAAFLISTLVCLTTSGAISTRCSRPKGEREADVAAVAGDTTVVVGAGTGALGVTAGVVTVAGLRVAADVGAEGLLTGIVAAGCTAGGGTAGLLSATAGALTTGTLTAGGSL